MTLAYAVGNPAEKPMTVVAHVVRLAPDGSVTPQRIHTGSAGLAAHVRVHGFGALPSARAPVNLDHRSKLTVAVLAALVIPSVARLGPAGPPSRRFRRPRAAPRPPPAQSSTAAVVDPPRRPRRVDPAPSTPPAAPTPSAQVDGPAAPAQQAQRLPSSLVAEAPTQVRLPGGRVVRIRPTRTLPDRSLRIPDDLHTGRVVAWRCAAR